MQLATVSFSVAMWWWLLPNAVYIITVLFILSGGGTPSADTEVAVEQ